MEIIEFLSRDELEEIYRFVKRQKEREYRKNRSVEKRENYNAYMRQYNKKKRGVKKCSLKSEEIQSN